MSQLLRIIFKFAKLNKFLLSQTYLSFINISYSQLLLFTISNNFQNIFERQNPQGTVTVWAAFQPGFREQPSAQVWLSLSLSIKVYPVSTVKNLATWKVLKIDSRAIRGKQYIFSFGPIANGHFRLFTHLTGKHKLLLNKPLYSYSYQKGNELFST